MQYDTVSEDHQVVPQEVIVVEYVTTFIGCLKRFQGILCSLTAVQLVLVARTQVDADHTRRALIQERLEDFKGHVKVVHFVVAQRNVDV
jgi:hypothetical protein